MVKSASARCNLGQAREIALGPLRGPLFFCAVRQPGPQKDPETKRCKLTARAALPGGPSEAEPRTAGSAPKLAARPGGVALAPLPHSGLKALGGHPAGLPWATSAQGKKRNPRGWASSLAPPAVAARRRSPPLPPYCATAGRRLRLRRGTTPPASASGVAPWAQGAARALRRPPRRASPPGSGPADKRRGGALLGRRNRPYRVSAPPPRGIGPPSAGPGMAPRRPRGGASGSPSVPASVGPLPSGLRRPSPGGHKAPLGGPSFRGSPPALPAPPAAARAPGAGAAGPRPPRKGAGLRPRWGGCAPAPGGWCFLGLDNRRFLCYNCACQAREIALGVLRYRGPLLFFALGAFSQSPPAPFPAGKGGAPGVREGGSVFRPAIIPSKDRCYRFVTVPGEWQTPRAGAVRAAGPPVFSPPPMQKDQAQGYMPFAWSVLMFARPFEMRGRMERKQSRPLFCARERNKTYVYFVAFASQKEKRSNDLPACPSLFRRTIEAFHRLPPLRGNKIAVLLRSWAWGGLYSKFRALLPPSFPGNPILPQNPRNVNHDFPVPLLLQAARPRGLSGIPRPSRIVSEPSSPFAAASFLPGPGSK